MQNTIEKIKKNGAEKVIKQMSFSELVNLIEFLVNNQGVTKVTLPISLDTFNYLHTLIDDNFRVINANGRGRKPIYDGWEYDKKCAYIITNQNMPRNFKIRLLTKLYSEEKQTNPDVIKYEVTTDVSALVDKYELQSFMQSK